MSGDRVSELQQQKRELDAALAEGRRQEKRARLHERDAQRSAARSWQLGPFLAHTALIIYSLAGYTAAPAGKFILNAGRQRQWPDKTEEDLEKMVEDLFLDISLEELDALTDQGSPADERAMKKALAVVEEWKLVVWAKALNDRGLAPSTSSVLQQLDSSCSRLPAEVRPRDVGSSDQTRARMWCLRWRSRWGARHGQIRVREDISVAEMMSKACEKT
jgi:hypothetical protein